MALSASARVNEKLYHARLLHNLAESSATQTVEDAARKMALQHAAVHATYAAYLLFVREIAESVKIKTPVETLADLQATLKKDGRQHAVAETLQGLLQQSASWLSQLHRAREATLFIQHDIASSKDPLAVKVVEQTDEIMPLLNILQNFQQFILEQRSYLQEW